MILARPVPVSDPSLAIRRRLNRSVRLARLAWLPWLPWLARLAWLVARRPGAALLTQLELLRLLDKERLGALAPGPGLGPFIGSARAARTTGTVRIGRVTRLIWGTRRGMRAEVGGQCRSSGVWVTQA
ncbi:MAG TPA: hypothetical protein VGM14_27095 [Streptosporangiaceae bacterium]